MKYEEIVKIITESASTGVQKQIERPILTELKKVAFTSKPLKVLTGLRRAGKSFLLKQLHAFLIKNNIPEENILFLNFENDLLIDKLNLKDLRQIYENFLSHATEHKPIYLFLDEIQNVVNWEKFVRTIYDSKNHNIFITGSNSRLLSEEFASALGGRTLEFNIHPFSFPEFLTYQNIPFQNEFEKAKNAVLLKKYFDTHLNFGGLPETFALDNGLKMQYRQGLIEKIIINDILKRFEIQMPDVLRKLIIFLEKNVGTTVSFRNAANSAQIDEKTIASYVSYLCQTFLISPVLKFNIKSKQMINAQKKYYFADNLFVANADIEDQLENLIFVHLSQKFGTQNVFFVQDGENHEIDFLVKNEKFFQAYQVCYELNDQNIKRETRSLSDFKKKNSSCKLNILYLYDQRKEKHEFKNIAFQNAVNYMLN